MSDMSTLLPLGVRVLADQAYEAIKAAILSLELEPGARVVERRLAEQLHVSKSPVREALQRLAAEGLVVQTPYAGMVVCRFDPSYVDELYELREVLEVMAVQLATPRLTTIDIEEAEAIFRDAVHAMERDDRIALGRAGDRFHAIFQRRSGNRPLQATLAGLRDKVRLVTATNWRARGATMSESHHQHEEIFSFARAGNVDAAAELMASHIRRGREEYRRFWPDR